MNVADAERNLGARLPQPLRDLYEQHDGWFNEGGQWWVLWPLDRLVGANKDAWQRGLPSTLVAFGDDGTGNPFCVERPDGRHVVRWSWIDMAAEPGGSSLAEWHAEWVESRA